MRQNFVLVADLLLLRAHMVEEWWEKVALQSLLWPTVTFHWSFLWKYKVTPFLQPWVQRLRLLAIPKD